MLISGPKKYAGCLILFEIIRVGPMEEFIFKQHKYHIPQQLKKKYLCAFPTSFLVPYFNLRDKV